MKQPLHMPPELDRRVAQWQTRAVIAGAVLLVLAVIGAFFRPDEFFRSYLFGYLFCLGIALGSMALVMTQYLTGGAWGVMTRRTFEAASRTLPWVALFFLPIILGIHYLYPWSHAELVRADEVLRHRAGYMNTPMFILRAIIYFALWCGLAYLLNMWSAREDAGEPQHERLEAWSAPGLILYVFTVTFASVDWAESLFTHWYSTMWGFLFVAGQGLTAICLAIAVVSLFSRYQQTSDAFRPTILHDLGKLLLMFVMLWAYFEFSQFLIVWSGNLTAEIPWFMPRWHHSWLSIGAILIVFEFMLPFLSLLSAKLKRNALTLTAVAGFLLFMRLVNLYWVVMPDFDLKGVHLHWLQFCVPLALISLWTSAFLFQLRRRPLLPLHAINLEEALHHAQQ